MRDRDPHQPEFLNAVHEVAASLQPVFEQRPEMLPVFRQLCEPERQIVFRVPWLDDKGALQVNRGFRVQFSSSIGPYKASDARSAFGWDGVGWGGSSTLTAAWLDGWPSLTRPP